MTETTEWFNFGKDSKAVRVLDKDNQKWMPVVDIASAIEYDRIGLSRILERNSDLFAGMKGIVVTTTRGGPQEHVCLNKDGIVGLLMKLNYTRIKNPEKQKRILDFQKWAIKVLSDVIAGKRQVVKEVAQKRRSPAAIAKDGLAFCRVTHSDPKETLGRMLIEEGYAYLPALLPPSHILLPSGGGQRSFAKSQSTLAESILNRKPGDQSLMPLIETITGKDLVPPSPKPEGMLSATDIGRIIGKTAEQVNQWLYNNKYIVKDADHLGEWRLESAGKDYGIESEPYRPHPAAKPVYRVYWYPKILEKFNVKV